MFCQACGTQVGDGGRFCPMCGVPMVAAQPTYAAYPHHLPRSGARVQRNLQTLGILWCVFGAYRIVAGLVGIFFLRAVTLRSFDSEGWVFGGNYHGPFGYGWIASLVPFVAVYIICVAVLALLVGYSLLTRRPWGRTLAIVIGILTLLKPILGTALGIYTLWVLAPVASGVEYDAIADRSV